MMPALVSAAIFIIALILILTEKLDRTIVAMAGAAVMVTTGHFMGFF
jgi:Na+/H+ antiporter NhaD/arsenite permease-like protein